VGILRDVLRKVNRCSADSEKYVKDFQNSRIQKVASATQAQRSIALRFRVAARTRV